MADNLAEQSHAFLQKAEIHNEWLSDYLNPDIDSYYDLAFAEITRKIGATDKTKLLDAGCGYCHHTVRIARSGARITAVDFSRSALSEARATLERHGLASQVTLQQGDLTALSLPDASFDALICWGVLMHIPELEKALSEFCRVLKPGGTLVLAENNVASLDVRIRDRAIDLIKKSTGRYRETRSITPRGEEVWKGAADAGGLMVRKSNIDYLVNFLAARNVSLVDRTAGQFSEAYTSLPLKPLKRMVYSFNKFYFSRGLSPRLALGNILYFRKKAL